MSTYTHGNNALSLDVVVQKSYSSGYYRGLKDYRNYQRRTAKQKRKERIEEIKLTIALFCGMIVFPLTMFLIWLTFGY